MNYPILTPWIFASLMTICIFIPKTKANPLSRDGESNSINIESGFPAEIQVSLYSEDNPIHMRLTRSTTVDPNVPLFVICNGTIFEKNDTHQMATGYYQNIDTGAALELSCENTTSDCIPAVSGSFYYNRILFELNPLNQNETLPFSTRRKRSTENHIMVQRTNFDGDEVDFGPKSVMVSVKTMVQKRRSKRAGYKTTRCIEMVAVVSFDLFESWYQRSPKFTQQEREDDALFFIRRYFALVVHGIDLRYSSIMTVDFSLCVRLSAYVIATTRLDSPWTEQKVFGNQVDGADVLPFFRKWSVHNGGKIGPYDHIQLFTAYDITKSGDASAVGLSYISSICIQPWPVSIVEDSLDIMHTTTAATHELGHSLGAYHDGQRNVCPSTSKYIMAPKIGRPLDANELNPWKFSPCSISYFAKTLRLLKRYNYDCLTNKPRLLDDGEWEFYTRHLPGQIYSPDQQCRLMHGETSFMSRKLLQEREVSNICTGMWCHSGGSKFTFHIPARGTSCGSKKWCIDGECKPNSAAPEISASCPYGDYQAEIFQGWDCKRLVQHWDYLCNWDYQGMQTKCCSSCAPILEKSRGKRSADILPLPSDEEIIKELTRRSLQRRQNIESSSIEINNLESILKTRQRRFTSKVQALMPVEEDFRLLDETPIVKREISEGSLLMAV